MTEKIILIVDDESSIRRGCGTILSKEGYNTDLAESGEQAIQMLKETRYDLIITDLQMYDIDGVKLLEHVRKNYPGTKMIMMTAYGSTDSALKALKQGAYDYLTKPFDLTALCSLVKRCLEETPQSQKPDELSSKKVTILNRLRKIFRYSEDVDEVDINQIILRIIKMYMDHFKTLNIEVATGLLVGLPKVLTDENAIEEVFIHLITNASDALLQEPVKEDKRIDIKSFVNEANEVVIYVKDNGCGIPKNKQQDIFKPGFTTKSPEKGMIGFGLSYSKKTIERAKGRIEYRTQEGVGSTFTVILPAAKKQEIVPQKEPEMTQPGEAAPEPAVQKKIPAKKPPVPGPKPSVSGPKPGLKPSEEPEIAKPEKAAPKPAAGQVKYTKYIIIGIAGVLLFAALFIVILRNKRIPPAKAEDNGAAAVGYSESVEKLCLKYASEGNFKSAIAEYKKTINSKTTSIKKIFKKGLDYKKEGLLKEAMVEFIKVIAVQPDYPEAYIELADIYKRKQMYDTGIIVCKQLLTIKSDYSLAQYTIASIYALKSNVKNSVKWLSWAKEQGSGYIDTAEKNTDFDNIRDSSGFKKLLKSR